jgi:hypothetical protein
VFLGEDEVLAAAAVVRLQQRVCGGHARKVPCAA